MFAQLDESERRIAKAINTRFEHLIDHWEAQARQLPNYEYMPTVDTHDYLSFTEWETDEVETLEEWKDMMRARRDLIDQKVREQRERFIERETGQVRRVRAQARKKAKQEGKTARFPRGRPRLNMLKEGQFVYLAIAYNHGQGAAFRGYVAEEPGNEDPTHIEDWEEGAAAL